MRDLRDLSWPAVICVMLFICILTFGAAGVIISSDRGLGARECAGPLSAATDLSKYRARLTECEALMRERK